MKIFKTKLLRITIAALVLLSVCTVTAFAATTAKATNSLRFRTAVINKLNVPAGTSVQVIRGGETLDAFEGMRLNSGDTVRTNGDAAVYILIDQNKIVRLAKDTEVVLENTLLHTKVRMKLVKGSMFFNVVEKLPEDESLQFVYGNITISVRGTSAVLSGQDGAFGMLLTDGTVEATETLPNGEQISAPIEAGTKFEYAAGDPEKGTQSLMKTSSFTLAELPPDVVEEMKNDEQLAGRIVGSVPVSTGPSGPVYTTPDKIDLEFDCNKGEDTMEPSREIMEKAQETNGVTVTPSPESNEGSNAEQTAESAGEQETGKTAEGTSADIGNSDNIISNGNIGNNGGAQENTHSSLTTVVTTVTCLFCGEEMSTEEYMSHLLPCGKHCGNQGISCSHEAADCGYHTDGCCEFHQVFGDHEPGCPVSEHSTCKNVYEWKKHLPVECFNAGVQQASRCLCCVGASDEIHCPLCGATITKEDITGANPTHIVYSSEWNCFLCKENGDMKEQYTSDFRDIFLCKYSTAVYNEQYGENFTEEELDAILRELNIELAPD